MNQTPPLTCPQYIMVKAIDMVCDHIHELFGHEDPKAVSVYCDVFKDFNQYDKRVELIREYERLPIDVRLSEKELSARKARFSNSKGVTDEQVQYARNIPMENIVRTFTNEKIIQHKIKCPFHNEKTGSFHVYPEGFKCFGCGVGGDGIKFVMLLENLTFIEAVKRMNE